MYAGGLGSEVDRERYWEVVCHALRKFCSQQEEVGVVTMWGGTKGAWYLQHSQTHAVLVRPLPSPASNMSPETFVGLAVLSSMCFTTV